MMSRLTIKTINKLRNINIFRHKIYSFSTSYPLSDKKILDDTDTKTEEIRKELTDIRDKELYEEYKQGDKGWIYDKKPFKYTCKAGKAYLWCACGRSHQQPFCDGTHKHPYYKITLKPVRWDCTETKEYWFCNCKQTQHRPFCDGTHKLPSVQNADSTIKDSQTKVTITTTDVKKIIKNIREQKPGYEQK